MRNNRTVTGWTAVRVEDYPIAPHRMRWDASLDVEPVDSRYSSFVEVSHYKPGEVVMLAYADGAVRARVTHVFAERSDTYGDLRHKYRVQRETKKGLWSKTWYYTYPGYIQRGYLRAGLAPDLEGKIAR